LLINLERVGDLGSRKDDVLYLGKCDDGVREFAKACGWLKELEARWAKTKPEGGEQSSSAWETVEPTQDQILQDQVDRLTSQVEKTLKLAGDNLTEATAEIGYANKVQEKKGTKKSPPESPTDIPSGDGTTPKDGKSVSESAEANKTTTESSQL